MFYKNLEYTSTPEFLASEKYQNFTCTVDDTGITADVNGKKIVPKGSLLDANGVIANDATVKGILFHDVDVTHGPQPGALMVEGYVLEARLPVAPDVLAKGAITEIKFR